MNKENEEKLFNRFKFFKPERPASEALMCFGFECSDGWFDLIWKLCEDVEKELSKQGSPKEKTKRLLQNYGDFEVVQVKEKFGGLRFYTNGSTKEINNLINKAESMSLVTCEECGKPGKNQANKGWIETLCDECRSK